ncbi:SseB family protein [Streptomyces johnsoniae]|uniref:SseB family protein n=1 Tax=Streptomyces johnsoniae TaxID=3075532 RepID=A0ABU2S1N4_9ACTN|nr:SseB family protein [Streptomyces sp. DSM 41886]MDT0442892.1 SseB family protein [Streptomyces sp. DSM 41886]
MAPKNIPRPAFADDDGTADPALRQALADWSADPAAEPALLAALRGARLLVPVVAVLGEAETGPDGLRREKSSDMAVLTLAVPDGRRALPVFTATDTLARWRGDARPVAVTVRQALSAAVQEGAGALVLDVAGPVAYTLAGPALRTVAAAGTPAAGPAVERAVHEVLRAEPAVDAARLVPGGPGDEADGTLALVLAERAPAAETVGRLARALAADEVLRTHLVRGLKIAVLPPGSALPGGPAYHR